MQTGAALAGFNEQYDRHGAWRRETALRLKALGDWLREHQLLDGGASEACSGSRSSCSPTS
jgi:hypothetical protein